MLTWIYKSQKREFTYIYLAKENDFSVIPDNLRPFLGDLSLVMSINLDETKNLANAAIENVKHDMLAQGFYIQLPKDDNKNIKN